MKPSAVQANDERNTVRGVVDILEQNPIVNDHSSLTSADGQSMGGFHVQHIAVLKRGLHSAAEQVEGVAYRLLVPPRWSLFDTSPNLGQ